MIHNNNNDHAIDFQGFIFIYQNFNCASKLKLILSIVDDDDVD